MANDFRGAETIIHGSLGRVFPAAQVEVRQAGEVLWSRAFGWLDPEVRQQPTRLDTLFDLASVTKLFVVTTFMTLAEEGAVALAQPVATVLPELSGERPILPYDDPLRPGAVVPVAWQGVPVRTVDASRVTFRHLLTHTSGLPAWRPLYKEASPEAARRLALATYFSYPAGARTIYSDIGLILLGMAIERLTGLPLDEAVAQRVTQPLGLAHTGYRRMSEWANERMGESANRQIGKPANRQISKSANQQTSECLPSPAGAILENPRSAIGRQPSSFAPTEFCAWRKRRIVGEVHDENAAGLGGVAGHAGLFSTASDLAAFGASFLPHRAIGPRVDGEKGASSDLPSSFFLLHFDTIAEMTRLQAQDGATRRGLGFALWSPDPEASGNPFSERAFGHTGFTGTSLWIDPQRSLVVAVCTNRVYYGRDASGILTFRVALHRAIVEAVG